MNELTPINPIHRADMQRNKVPEHLLDVPYSRDLAFQNINHHMTVLHNAAYEAGGWMSWVRSNESDFLKVTRSYGYTDAAVGFVLCIYQGNTKTINSGVKAARKGEDRLRSIPDVNQLQLALKDNSAVIESFERMETELRSTRARAAAADNARAKSDNTLKNMAAELNAAKQKLDRLENWKPEGLDQVKLHSLLKMCLDSAYIIRAQLHGVRLRPPMDSVLAGHISEMMDAVLSQIRAGEAWIKAQLACETYAEYVQFLAAAEDDYIIGNMPMKVHDFEGRQVDIRTGKPMTDEEIADEIEETKPPKYKKKN